MHWFGMSSTWNNEYVYALEQKNRLQNKFWNNYTWHEIINCIFNIITDVNSIEIAQSLSFSVESVN